MFEEVVCLASDCSGMTESDVLAHCRQLKKELPVFNFEEWYCEEEFLERNAFFRIKKLID